jgi:nitrate reductase gamma subunit
MPNAVARVLTPLQIGIVLVLLGVGLLLLRNVEPDMNVPMLVLGTLALMPGIGFILSAGVTWVLARRLGLMPEQADSEPVGPRERL